MSTLKTDTLSNVAGSKSVPMNTVVDGSAKAWVNFNGTGTVAIRAAFNVSSITDNGAGDYTVNFTSALTDANYALCGFANNSTNATPGALLTASNTFAPASGSIRFQAVLSGAYTPTDPGFVNIAVFR